MNKCSKCSALIPSGRTYCDAHYHEAIEKYNDKVNEYNAKLEKFNQDTKIWNSLTPAQRKKKDEEAEEQQLTMFIVIFSLAIGTILGSLFHNWIIGTISSILIGGVILTYKEKAKKLAKILRAATWGLGYFLLALIILHFLGFQSSGGAGSVILILVVLMGAMAGSWQLEVRGFYHASGAPKKPSAPGAKPRP